MKKEKHINHIHIGSIIKKKAVEKGISETQLAKMIHCHTSTVCYIYKNETINTERLWKISIALEYDFFTEVYGNNLPDYVKNKINSNTVTIVVSSEKVSIEQKTGITKITEYRKIP